MTQWNEGNHVRIIERPATTGDRKTNRYFEHMAGLTGTIQNIYSTDEIAVKIDLESLSEVAADVHTKSVKRMREKFLSSISEEQKGKLTSEELNFSAHYVLLVKSVDLESV